MNNENNQLDGKNLTGVPETSLWILNNRAMASASPKVKYKDPMAEQLKSKIEFDYSKFGTPMMFHASRALTVDAEVINFAKKNPDGTVVALAEGMQTTYWRIGDLAKNLNWITLDLPEIIEIRERLLPKEKNITNLAISVLDPKWFESIPKDKPTLITAEGLLMYLEPRDVYDLFEKISSKLPGSTLFFDTMPPFFKIWSFIGFKPTKNYTVPRMPFSVTPHQAKKFESKFTGIESVQPVKLINLKSPLNYLIQLGYVFAPYMPTWLMRIKFK